MGKTSTWKTALIGLAGGVFGAVAVFAGQGFELHIHPVGMSYADLAATLLAAVAILTTVLGIFLAILAVWGFTALKGSAKNAAKAHVSAELKEGELRSHLERTVTEFLSGEFKDGALRKLLENRVDAVLFSGPAERADEEDIEDDTTEDVAPQDNDGNR